DGLFIASNFTLCDYLARKFYGNSE
ncbi:inositol monophosphatase, partial [Ehrlichia ruminantium]